MTSLAALLRRSFAQSWRVVLAVALIAGGFQLVIIAQASSLQEAQSFGRVAELIPGFLQRGLGSMALLLASFKGSVTAGYFHPVIVLMMAQLAIYVATEPAHEVESGLVDVVLARPLRRRAVMTRSLIVAFGGVTIVGGAMGIGTWAGLRAFASPAWDWPSAALVGRLLVHLLAAAWCFGAIALAVAAGAERRATAVGLVGVAAVLLYLLDFLALTWAPARPLARLSPFHYYPAVSILAGVAPPWRNLALLASATVAFAGVAYWRFSRRDL
jgi:ABC-2 type transport system permease protein